MIEQIVASALIGAMVAAFVVARIQKARSTEKMVQLGLAVEARIASVQEEHTRLVEEMAECRREKEALSAEAEGLRERLAACVEESGGLRAELDAMIEAQTGLAHQAKEIADEAARLKALAATFERWHEQMQSLMSQNQDMHAKNEELVSIARHVVIVSLNASIEASRAGAAGRGFAIVANEVRSLALRTEGLSKDHSVSLYRNDLTTTATFQDIQAGGKMIMAALSMVEAKSNKLYSRFERALP